MRISIIGLGYVGMPNALMLADSGLFTQVVGVDINSNQIDNLRNGICHIDEPELMTIWERVRASGKMRFSTQIVRSNIYLICVPTPLNGLKADISLVEGVFNDLFELLQDDDLIIIESTCPIGTSRYLYEKTRNKRNVKLKLAYCPERILPGNSVHELVWNNRLIGGIDQESAQTAADIYKSFVKADITQCLAEEAEFAKLAENSFRDVQIAIANSLSMIAAELNLCQHRVIELANMHPRVNILSPGPGVGGHCIAVDPHFLIEACPTKAQLFKVARETNRSKTLWVAEQIWIAYEENVNKGSQSFVCLFGMAYKADIGDARESPTLDISRYLMDKGVHIQIVDPYFDDDEKIVSIQSLASLTPDVRSNSLAVMLVNHSVFEGEEWLKVIDSFPIYLDFSTKKFS